MSSLYYEIYCHFQTLNFLFNPKWTFNETKQQKQLKKDPIVTEYAKCYIDVPDLILNTVQLINLSQ